MVMYQHDIDFFLDKITVKWCGAGSTLTRVRRSHAQQGSREHSGEGLGGFGASSTGFRRRSWRRFRGGGFGAEPGQVQPGCREFGDTHQKVFNRLPTKVGAKPGEVQQGSECSEKGTEEDLRGFGAEPREESLVQSKVMFNRGPGRVLGKVGEALVQS